MKLQTRLPRSPRSRADPGCPDLGHGFTPRVSVSSSVIPVVDDADRMPFGLRAQADSRDQVGMIDGLLSRFGKSYRGAAGNNP